MGISTFIEKGRQSLTQVIQFRTMMSELDRTHLEASLLLPIAVKYQKAMSSPRAGVSRDLIKRLNHIKNDISTKNFLGDVVTALGAIETETAVLSERLSGGVMSVLMQDSISTRHLNALKLQSTSDFFIARTKPLLAAMASAEVGESSGSDKRAKSATRYIEQSFINDPEVMTSYASTLEFYNRTFKKGLVNELWEAVDVKADPKVLQIIETAEGAKKLDPVGFNYLNVVNPFFWAYMPLKIWSECKLYRLRLNEEELQLLDLRYQELLLERQDRSSPKLDEQIERYEASISKTRRTIKKIQDSLGD